MTLVRSIVVASIVIALMLLGSRLVAAQSQPGQYYGSGGGMISGTVLGFDMYDELQPIVWAAIYADNGQRTFIAYSSSGGLYEMFVPVGTYNVTVLEAGYKQISSSVSVSDGSSSIINFNLEQSHVPVPEFPASSTLVMLAALSLAMLALRRRKRSA
jgi:hypothetical protein